MDPSALLEYLGYEYNNQDNEKMTVEFYLLYKTIDDYSRVGTGKFSFQYLRDTKMVCRFFWIEKISLPIGHAEDAEKAITVARTYLERIFTDFKFAITEEDKFLHLWEEKRKEREQYNKEHLEENKRKLADALEKHRKKSGNG